MCYFVFTFNVGTYMISSFITIHFLGNWYKGYIVEFVVECKYGSLMFYFSSLRSTRSFANTRSSFIPSLVPKPTKLSNILGYISCTSICTALFLVLLECRQKRHVLFSALTMFVRWYLSGQCPVSKPI